MLCLALFEPHPASQLPCVFSAKHGQPGSAKVKHPPRLYGSLLWWSWRHHSYITLHTSPHWLMWWVMWWMMRLLERPCSDPMSESSSASGDNSIHFVFGHIVFVFCLNYSEFIGPYGKYLVNRTTLCPYFKRVVAYSARLKSKDRSPFNETIYHMAISH